MDEVALQRKKTWMEKLKIWFKNQILFLFLLLNMLEKSLDFVFYTSGILKNIK